MGGGEIIFSFILFLDIDVVTGVNCQSFSCIQHFVTSRTCQAPLFMEFSSQEYWSG